jgi:hypothetical protein
MAFKLFLYYDVKSGYSDKIPELVSLLHLLSTQRGAEFEVIPHDKMTGESESNLKKAIYELQIHPQGRGQIVTSRGNMLPFSKGKNLNLANTPILLVEENGKPIDVLPKRVQGHFTSVEAGLLEMLENSVQFGKAVFSAENLAISRIMKDPRVIEDGLEIIGQEVDIPAGKIDLLAKDQNQRFLVVEFEREATDASLGQIIRLGASFAKLEKVPPNVVRKMIVCGRAYDHHKEAAESVGIEVRILPLAF